MLVWLKITTPEDQHSSSDKNEQVEKKEFQSVEDGLDEEGGKHGGSGDSYSMLRDEEEEQKHEAETKPVFGWLYNIDVK